MIVSFEPLEYTKFGVSFPIFFPPRLLILMQVPYCRAKAFVTEKVCGDLLNTVDDHLNRTFSPLTNCIFARLFLLLALPLLHLPHRSCPLVYAQSPTF